MIGEIFMSDLFYPPQRVSAGALRKAVIKADEGKQGKK